MHSCTLLSCALLAGRAAAQRFWNIWIFSDGRFSKYFAEPKQPFVQTSGPHQRMMFIIMEVTRWSEISCRNYFVCLSQNSVKQNDQLPSLRDENAEDPGANVRVSASTWDLSPGQARDICHLGSSEKPYEVSSEGWLCVQLPWWPLNLKGKNAQPHPRPPNSCLAKPTQPVAVPTPGPGHVASQCHTPHAAYGLFR